MSTLNSFKRLWLLLILAWVIFPSLALAENAFVGGIWQLKASGVSKGCTPHTPCMADPPYKCGTAICGPFNNGDPDMDVTQSGTQLSAHEGDGHLRPFTLEGTVNGNSVNFTIKGDGITAGIGNATTTYKGKLKGNIISGNFTGEASWIYDNGQGQIITETATWTGNFTVKIMKIVLLLHGIWDDGQNCWNKSGVENLLLDNGFHIFTFNFCPNNGSIINDAHQLAEKVISLVSLYPGVEINIVSHSKGGLVARYYLAHQELWPIDEYGVPRHGIKKLITLGTPHLGTDIHLLHPIASNMVEFERQNGNPCTGYQCENEYWDMMYGIPHFTQWSKGLRQMTAEWRPPALWRNKEPMSNEERWFIPDHYIGDPLIDPEEWRILRALFPLVPFTGVCLESHRDYYNEMIVNLASETLLGRRVSPFLKEISLNIPPDIDYYLFAGAKRTSWEQIWCLPVIKINVKGDYEDGVVPKASAWGQGLPFVKIKRYNVPSACHIELPLKTKQKVLDILIGKEK